MNDRPSDSGAPVGQPRGRLSSRPAEDRATPIADGAMDYSSYIAAIDMSSAEGRTTARIDAVDLERLRNAATRTGSNKRPPELAATVPRPAQAAVAVRPSRARALLVMGGLAATFAGALWLVFSRRAPVSTTPLPPAPAVAVSAVASSELPAAVTATPAADGPIPADDQARKALERLRAGLGECFRGVHGLTGSSPAVPSSLSALAGGSYTPAATEWKTAVWSCAHFEMNEPMRFQLQWQLLKPSADGLAVAWIDADGDGVADRALGFHITAGPRGQPVLGDIGPLAATHPVLVLR